MTDGSSVVIGSFESSSITFGSTTLTNAGSGDIFVAQLDSNGNWVWAVGAGGDYDKSYGRSIATLIDGSSVVTGYYDGYIIRFGSATFTHPIAGNTNAGDSDIFVAKLDSNGNWIWAIGAGGSDADDEGHGIATLADGSSVVTGSFESSSITFGSTTLSNAGSGDIFVAKLDSNGNWIWAVGARSSYYDIGRSIATLTDGSFIVTGNYNYGSITFGSTTLSNAGSGDIFVAKLDSNGNWVWAVGARSSYYDYGTEIATLTDGSSVVTGGYRSSSITFGSTTLTKAGSGAGSGDVFVAKVDTALPTSLPTSSPTIPTSVPTGKPSSQPTRIPSSLPTLPTSQPSSEPSSHPTSQPSSQPSSVPSSHPLSHPSSQPSSHPSSHPTSIPTGWVVFTTPNENTEWVLGTTIRVEWSGNDLENKAIHISLKKDDEFKAYLVTSKTSSEKYILYQLPDDINGFPFSTNYQIRIEDASNPLLYRESEYFQYCGICILCICFIGM